MENMALIIPAYNEERRIGKTLEAYSKFFEKMRAEGKLNYLILVVINNTSDSTEEIVKVFAESNKRISYLNLTRGGKGYAIIEGFKKTIGKKYSLVGFVDADMATSPEEYWKLIENIGKSSGIVADRYLKKSKVYPPVTFRRIIVGRTFNFIVRGLLVLPYRDTQCGAKLFRENALSVVLPELSLSEWAFDVELLYLLNKRGYKIKSFPTMWTDIEYSKINFIKATPGMLLGVLRLRLINSIFKDIIRAYDKIVGFRF